MNNKFNHQILNKSFLSTLLNYDLINKLDLFLSNVDLTKEQKIELISLIEEITYKVIDIEQDKEILN